MMMPIFFVLPIGASHGSRLKAVAAGFNHMPKSRVGKAF
jgi:hypothetical protein